MTTFEDAIRDANEEARLPGRDLPERLLERLGGVANAEAVFGSPVERDGITVIPVAKVRWGAGGGGGGEGAESGSGGGGGLQAAPAGYIEISGGQARFVRTSSIADQWPVLLAAAAAIWLVLRAVRPFFR